MRAMMMTVVAACALAIGAGATAQVGTGLIDPNVATTEQLAALPGMTGELVALIEEARPFADALAFDIFLGDRGMNKMERETLYGEAFIHINLNTATEAEMLLIPGVGARMAHEFDEYRPWVSFAQFDKEIGKYVDEAEVARLKQYCFIPLDLNTATEAEFMTIPGVGKRMAHEFEEYRPWTSQAQFEKEIGKYVDEREVARLWRYVVIR
jgi:DNA uptake protein ComE-like DNA-binding protein